MIELKEALAREPVTSMQAKSTQEPLKGILRSFVVFYKNLQTQTQRIENHNTALKQAQDQAQAKADKGALLRTELEAEQQKRKVYQEELEFALKENIKYVAKTQGEIDPLNMRDRRLQRQYERSLERTKELTEALDETKKLLVSASIDLTEHRLLASQLSTEKGDLSA